ncbi:MAG: factor H binding protein domain-containing protein, partial [Pseudomonadota bacterium]
GQRHADRQLQRMNQGGGRMKDLGLSDGRGGKDKEARMDPVELADDLTDGSGGNPGNGNGEQNLLALNQVPNNQEDTQRRDIEEVIPDSGGGEPLPEDYQGFSAGIFEWCPDGCLAQEIMVEGSSDSVLLHFRPSEFQVDAALNLFGDMLFGNSEPGTAFSLTSACSISDEGCSYYTEEVGVYSEYLDKNNFAVFLDDWNNGVFRSFWTSELETDSSQFDYSAWGYWYDFNGDTGEYFEGYWVAGQLTPAANIPASGSAAYTGGVVGITENFAYLEGSMNWTVNFASRTVSGTFDNLVYAGTDSVWLSQVDANGGWSAGSNAVSATLSGANVVSGTAKGAFYGPNAEELGGAWQIKKSSGDGYENAAGIFLSKPEGTAFYDCNARGCYGRQSAR